MSQAAAGSQPTVPDVRRFPPSADLSEFVRYYVYCDFLPALDTPHPMTVSLFPILNFFLAKPCRVFEYAHESTRRLAPAVAIGPCDRRVADVFPDGRYTSLMAAFQPTGFYRLFHTSPQELLNFAHDANDVVGNPVVQAHDRVREESTPQAMVRRLETMLRERARQALPASPLAQAANVLLDAGGSANLSMLAHGSGFSDSSWRRRFQEQIGIAPKRFSRMIRFQRAVALKLNAPRRSWTDISIDAGYYDQAHLIGEFREFSDCVPSGFLRELASLPQSVAGSVFSASPDWEAAP